LVLKPIVPIGSSGRQGGAKPPKGLFKMYKIENGVIHGNSYATMLRTVEFITWRLNEEKEEYWMKFHLPSGKEIRIKVDEYSLREIIDEWAEHNLELELGDEYGLD
tara:strand:- start:12053 stop:12370 length:318 start_codon:yes stop_codon:yes gene_type:complete